MEREDVKNIDWTWKVFSRDDGSWDFLPTETETHFKIEAVGLPLRDAMALCDEKNAELNRITQP